MAISSAAHTAATPEAAGVTVVSAQAVVKPVKQIMV